MTFVKNSLCEKSEIYYQRAEIYDALSMAEDAEGHVFNFLLPYVRNKTVLDLGCGTGKYLKLFSPHAQHITGLDAAEAQLSIARNKIKDCTNVSLVCGDAMNANLPLDKYEIIIACWVLGTIEDENKRLAILKYMERLLSPGGAIYLVENDATGRFEIIRGKTALSSAYNEWLRNVAHFEPAAKLATHFHFNHIDHAKDVIGTIWGPSVGSKVTSARIKHKILIFKKTP